MSAVVIVWLFHGLAEDRERRALKLIAMSFFALAAYVGVQAVFLAIGDLPEECEIVPDRGTE